VSVARVLVAIANTYAAGLRLRDTTAAYYDARPTSLWAASTDRIGLPNDLDGRLRYLTVLHAKGQRTIEAESAFNEILGIAANPEREHYPARQTEVADSLMRMAIAYHSRDLAVEALINYEAAIDILEPLAKANQRLYGAALARALEGLGGASIDAATMDSCRLVRDAVTAARDPRLAEFAGRQQEVCVLSQD